MRRIANHVPIDSLRRFGRQSSVGESAPSRLRADSLPWLTRGQSCSAQSMRCVRRLSLNRMHQSFSFHGRRLRVGNDDVKIVIFVFAG